MKFRILLLTGFLALFGATTYAQTCAAYGYFTQSGATITFNDTSYSPSGHMSQWSFGDGVYGSGTTVTHTYTSNGTYTASLYIYDSTGNCGDSAVFTVHVNTLSNCNASFTFNPDTPNSAKIHFYGSTLPSGGSASWNIYEGGATHQYTGQYISHTFSSNGSYSVVYTLYDSSGATCDSIDNTIQVYNQSCNASFTSSVDSSNGLKLYFNGNTSPTGGSSAWHVTGNGTTTTYSGQSISHTFSSSGYYSVCYTLYDSSGNVCDSICHSAYVPGNGGSTSGNCDAYFYTTTSGLTATFYDSLTATSTFQWAFGDGSYSTSVHPTHTYSASGTYNVCLFVYDVDSAGNTSICDSFCHSVTVSGGSNCNATFNFVVDSMNTSASSFPVAFYNYSDSTYAYIWNFGDGSSDTSRDASHVYSSSGTYTVCLYLISGLDSSGNSIICDSVCHVVTVGTSSGSSCQASYYLGIDSANIYNLYIINNSTGTSSTTNYYWTFGDGTGSTAQNPTHQYASFGLYQLCLTLQDSVAGCYSTYCDSIGLDSNGNLLKKDGFGITIVDEKDVLNIADSKSIEGVNVYPNPSAGMFTLDLTLKASQNLELDVVNSLGQVVAHKSYFATAGDNKLVLDLTNQENGLYFIKMKAGNQIKNTRVYIIK
ncbi:MAG: hypothetical protein COA58_14845 [Bacteroidetes bacterium]|nr:MAG: hypothetical protein COA58_14845 [Bacteroidota bacterium]